LNQAKYESRKRGNLKLSVVIPIFNEEETLLELRRRLKISLDELTGGSYEVIFVDDGSKDRSWEIIEGFNREDAKFKALKFSRNFGHHIAITAGLDYSTGEAVVLMDGDLQDQPEEISKLYTHFLKGFDVVFGIRQEKQHSLMKRVSSSLFIYLINKVIDVEVPINSHIFRIMSRKVVTNLNKLRERDRFITGLVSYMGFKQVGINVIHGARYAGQTKYSLFKLFKLAFNAITSFSIKPLQVATTLGVFVSLVSFIGIIYLISLKILFNTAITGWTSVMVLILFMGGVQMLLLGILGEYVGRNYAESQKRPLYIIDQTLSI
jgi:glycosyltransferase involved in cell wall biosynthesis